MKRFLISALCVLVLAACSSGGTGNKTGSEPSASSAGSIEPTPETATTEPATEDDGQKATILKSGFGQQNEYVWVTSLVRNDSSKVGQTVTVQFNLLDAKGTILASDDQVESFSRPGQLLVLGTQIAVQPGQKVAKIEPTLEVEYPGIGSEDAFPAIAVGPVTITSSYGSFEAQAQLSNPTASNLKSPRVGVICYSAAGSIIGGNSIFPDLVPAHGKVLAKTTGGLYTSKRPAKCEMYAGPGL